ncbi:MAG: hypothetical protein JNK87_06030 [Bryobacterales bacterium]|nr:hypothetical protein [Bryobacterales bacterium]
MATLATHAGLGGLYGPAFRQRQAPGGVALEAAQDGGIGGEGTVPDAGSVDGVAGRSGKAAFGFVEALGVLQIVIFVDLGNVGDRLCAGSESPAILVAGECRRVVGFGLRGGDPGMTNGTGRRPGWIGGL